ncbi:hypothetical protein FALBO_14347 [Fusarium albosuccineum]|uniref:Altered inheritance of mitochondria protein 21 n=1 Tax=Fusarium albosuccineum TaxID=1237068 RepID=A0A8H4L0B3_9HYPO|nr:hypothetical protein FALBO_14347 [Fusarium albosuccineum]
MSRGNKVFREDGDHSTGFLLFGGTLEVDQSLEPRKRRVDGRDLWMMTAGTKQYSAQKSRSVELGQATQLAHRIVHFDPIAGLPGVLHLLVPYTTPAAPLLPTSLALPEHLNLDMTAATMQQTPAIPPRPAKGQDKSDSAGVPKIPPRPSKRFDRSISPNPDRFAPSPFNEGIPQKSPKALRFSPNNAVHEHGQDPIDRSSSVPMPSIGQEGVEYSAVSEELKADEEETGEKPRASSPEQTRTVAEDLKLHAPKPSLPAHSAKQRVQAVTRTDSDRAASFGIGRPTSREGLKKKPSSSFSTSEGRPEIEDEHGIPEIGQRVPMNPHLGDVQAPSPGPGSEEFKKHHHRKHSSRGGPPGSYGLHGHGVAPQDKLDKDYYEKHPDLLKREHQTPLHDRQNDYALSSNDLNKLVRDTRNRGSGLGTSEYQSTPTDEVGFQASEEYASRLSPRPTSTAEDKIQPLSFKSEITGPDGEKTVHVDDPKHPEYRSYGDEDAAVDDEDHEYTAPILASDEVNKDDRPCTQQPAVHPAPERRGSANEMEEPTSRPASRSSRPRSRPTSIYKNNDSQEFEPTSLDDVKEYEPLFPEEAKKESQPPAEGSKARHYFPSKDVWEDAPNSVHYTAEVSTPDVTEQPRRLSAADRPKTPAHLFAQKQEELAEREAGGPADAEPSKTHEKPIWTESQESDSFLSNKARNTHSQRFPSRDVWEDVPESQLYETTVSETVDEKEESKPEIPSRPVKTASEDRPALPERPKPKHTPSDEGKPKPPVSDKPKPQIPPRPTKTSSGDSKDGEAKVKPPVPSRPVGGKIAALQAGFMSDLNKRLQLGPSAPKKEEPKPQEDLTEQKEKAPLSDARKGRARGPQRRAPARSPAAPAAKPSGPALTFSLPQTLWSIDPEGSLSVSGEESPVPEQEIKVEKEAPEEPAPQEPAQSEPQPEVKPETETVEAPTEPKPEMETKPKVDIEQPVQEQAQEPAVEPSEPKEVPVTRGTDEPTHELAKAGEPVAEEKTLATNTAGESILETTVEKKGDTVEPLEVSDEVKQ